MKKLEMKEIYDVEIKDLKLREGKCLNGLEKLDLEKTRLVRITTHTMYGSIIKYGTSFCFETEDGAEIYVVLKENKDAKEIYIEFVEDEKRTYGEIASYRNERRQFLNNIIWDQFVKHFNLRIRLIFINETTPWKWDV